MAALFFRRSPFAAGLGLTLLPTLHADADELTVVDPASGIAFPKTVKVPGQFQSPTMQLVGVGVRTVSFLGIQVYSLGFYADLSSPALRLRPDMNADEKIEHIIRNTACLLRLIPTRNTNFQHLRDAFVRMLNARQIEAKKAGTFTEEDALVVAGPIRALKTMFPNSNFAKGAILDLFLPAPVANQPRPLIVRDLGAVQNTWVSTELFLHYFAGKGASPALKNSTVARVEELGS